MLCTSGCDQRLHGRHFGGDLETEGRKAIEQKPASPSAGGSRCAWASATTTRSRGEEEQTFAGIAEAVDCQPKARALRGSARVLAGSNIRIFRGTDLNKEIGRASCR